MSDRTFVDVIMADDGSSARNFPMPSFMDDEAARGAWLMSKATGAAAAVPSAASPTGEVVVEA